MRPPIKLIAIIMIMGLLLVACGKKGPVRPVSGPLPVNSVTSGQEPLPACCN